MRPPRILAPWSEDPRGNKPAIYHCISRVVNREFVLGEEEKDQFVEFMQAYAAFSGVHILTYCVMSNHFHLLVEVPPKAQLELTDLQLLERMSYVYDEPAMMGFSDQLAGWNEGIQKAKGCLKGATTQQEAKDNLAFYETGREEFRERFLKRMHDLSAFMKALKQRFTQWFNGRHRRRGTLWESRFKSVLVESGSTAKMMAAYIDLNPIRAGMVDDPSEYQWCGYAQAVKGKRLERRLLSRLWQYREISTQKAPQYPWRQIVAEYEVLLYGEGRVRRGENNTSEGKVLKAGMDEEESKRKQESASKIAKDERKKYAEKKLAAEMIRQNMRHFNDGVAIGSKEFIEQVFEEKRECFGDHRETGSRRIPQLKEQVYSMRTFSRES